MYDTIASGYNELHREEQLRKLHIVKGNVNITSNTTVLDVGCGTGLSAFFNCKLQGIDPSVEMLKYCSFPATEGKAEHLPFADNSFDLVMCITVLHHTDIEQALKEISRVASHTVVISILNNHRQKIEKYIKQYFSIEKIIKEQHDIVYFLST